MDIDHTNLSRLDLNLLVAFDALLTERNVTQAAARLGLGQSAMSHNLGRLRRVFGDELFTRGPKGMQPTPRTLVLAAPVRAALAQIQSAVLQREAFEPATSERAFRIGLADSIEVAVVPALMERLQAEAPGVSIRLRSTNHFSVLEALDRGHLDLGIGVFDHGRTHHKLRPLYTDHFLCLFSPAQLGLTPPLSLKDYLRFPHVLTSLTGDAKGIVDEALAKRKRRRTIVLTTPGFLAVPFVLRRAGVIATMPARLARYFSESFGLATSPVPVPLPRFTMSLLWHGSLTQDPGLVWLRRTLASLVAEDDLEL